MAEPKTGILAARQAAGNASRGIRQRLAVFLRSDAARMLRAGRGPIGVMTAGGVGGVLMVLSEFFAVRYVNTNTASCHDLATPALKDNCLVIGHESHYWAFALLGLFVVVMAFGATAGRSRPAVYALLTSGVVALGITLIRDLPQTQKSGVVNFYYGSKNAHAHAGIGFWLELIGALLAVGAAVFALTQLPVGAPAEGEVEAEEEAAEPEAAKEAEPEEVEASPAEAPAQEAAVEPTRAERIRAARRRLGERLRRPRPAATPAPADVGADEGSEGEAVEPESAEAAETEEAGARAAKTETVEAGPAEAEPAEDETPEAEPAQTEPEGDTWDVIPDTPAARRSAERRRKRQERAEAARKRQKRPPRERDRKKRPPGGGKDSA